MNIELMTKVRDAIANEDNTFDMAHWYVFNKAGCRTPACIAGWAIHLSGLDEPQSHEVSRTAVALLELSGLDTIGLFAGAFAADEYGNIDGDITRKETIAELNRLIKRGLSDGV